MKTGSLNSITGVAGLGITNLLLRINTAKE
jgi:hypothetical protein